MIYILSVTISPGKYLPFTSITELFYNYWKTLFVGL